jgi:hypothetical protein
MKKRKRKRMKMMMMMLAALLALTPRLVVGLGIGSVGLGYLRLEILQTLPQN